MNFKTLNFLGILAVFIGLFSLMSLHISHEILEDSSSEEENHSESEGFRDYYHIFIGFPVSILGAMLLILAEKQQANSKSL